MVPARAASTRRRQVLAVLAAAFLAGCAMSGLSSTWTPAWARAPRAPPLAGRRADEARAPRVARAQVAPAAKGEATSEVSSEFVSQTLAALSDGKPMVVDFTHRLCGPCKRMSKVLDQVEEEFAGQVTVLKLPVQKHVDLARGLGVSKVPTVFLFPVGAFDPVQMFVGLAKGEDISAAIKQHFPEATC